MMEEHLHSEPMLFSHLDEVLDIERLSFAAPWSRNMFMEEMANDASHPIVFKDQGNVVGYLCFWVILDEGHLHTIAVRPDYRKKGLGLAMMNEFERLCREFGLKRLFLDVGKRNDAAKKLYRKSGFQSIGFRKNYYAEEQDDAIVMEKRL